MQSFLDFQFLSDNLVSSNYNYQITIIAVYLDNKNIASEEDPKSSSAPLCSDKVIIHPFLLFPLNSLAFNLVISSFNLLFAPKLKLWATIQKSSISQQPHWQTLQVTDVPI